MQLKGAHIIAIAVAMLLAAALLVYRHVTGNGVSLFAESAAVEAKRETGGQRGAGGSAGKDSLPGMPKEYVLTEKQREQKRRIASDGVIGNFDSLAPGTDYVENQFVFEAGNEREAKTIAEAYAGKLVRFSYGVAVAELVDTDNYTLADLLALSADLENNMPPIALNYIQRSFSN